MARVILRSQKFHSSSGKSHLDNMPNIQLVTEQKPEHKQGK